MKGMLTAALVLSIAIPVIAADQTWSGTLSDKMCGADHKAMGSKLADRDCTLSCTKDGTPYVLVSGDKIYRLTGHEGDLKTHAGHAVTVIGELKGDTIRVSRIEMPKSQTN